MVRPRFVITLVVAAAAGFFLWVLSYLFEDSRPTRKAGRAYRPPPVPRPTAGKESPPKTAVGRSNSTESRKEGVKNPTDVEKAKTKPPRIDQALLARGKAVYEAACVSCHGPRGRGDGPAAKDLAGSGEAERESFDFARPAKHQPGGWSVRGTFNVIRSGVHGSSMPALVLPDKGVWGLAGYVLQLREQAVKAGTGKDPSD